MDSKTMAAAYAFTAHKTDWDTMITNAPSSAAVALLDAAQHAMFQSLACGVVDDIPVVEVRAALARILADAEFAKARRTSRLLQFLVEKRLANAVRDTHEFTIAIEVFERDPATFNPGEDPVVRVQVGRLREKLKHYYATPGPHPAISFAIPIGSYMPVIRRERFDAGHCARGFRLAIVPLTCIASDVACVSFTHGLGEELTYQLFQQFGDKVVSPRFAGDGAMATDHAGAVPAPSHVLEGSVRVDSELIRVGIRVIDAGTGSIVWSQQVDRHRSFSIPLQQELGFFICGAMKRYFHRDQSL